MGHALLEVTGLTTVFDGPGGPVTAVDGVRLAVDRGGVLAVVGESGCGKTVLSLSLLGLVAPPGRVTAGQVALCGTDILALPESGRRAIRGRRAAMIFQEPMTALNPVLTIGEQVAEPLRTRAGRPLTPPRRCWPGWACPNRAAGCSAIPTNCPVASASGS